MPLGTHLYAQTQRKFWVTEGFIRLFFHFPHNKDTDISTFSGRMICQTRNELSGIQKSFRFMYA